MTVISTASSGGSIFIHLLTDEIQPAWLDDRPCSGLVPCVQQDPTVSATLVDVVVCAQGKDATATVYSDPSSSSMFVACCEGAIYCVEVGWLNDLMFLTQEEATGDGGDNPDRPTVLRVLDDPLCGVTHVGCFFWFHSAMLAWMDDGLRLTGVHCGAVSHAPSADGLEMNFEPIESKEASGDELRNRQYVVRLDEQRSAAEELAERFEQLAMRSEQEEEQWSHTGQLMRNLEDRYAVLAECLDVLECLPSKTDATMAQELCLVDVGGLWKRMNVVEKNIGGQRKSLPEHTDLPVSMSGALKSEIARTGKVLQDLTDQLEDIQDRF